MSIVTRENAIEVMGETIQLPSPKTKAAERALSVLPRALAMLPPEFADRGRAYCMALASELNKLPENTDPYSAMIAVGNLSLIGLIPGAVFGHAYLVPFFNSKKNCNEATLITGYRGYLELAFANQFLKGLHADVVLDGEAYEQFTTRDGADFKHVPGIERDRRWEKVVGAYCCWQTALGGTGFHFVPRSELDKLKKRHGKHKNSTWNTVTVDMCIKTPIRRASKYWQLTQRQARATYLDEQVEELESRQEILPEAQSVLDVIEDDVQDIDTEALRERLQMTTGDKLEAK